MAKSYDLARFMDFYERETLDFKCVKGDTFNIPLQFKDENGNSVDISGFGATLTVRDPLSDATIDELIKTHNDAISGGNGIYFYGDTYAWTELGLTSVNQMQIVFSADDTDELTAGLVYRFDLELTKTINGTVCRKSVSGTISIEREVTENV